MRIHNTMEDVVLHYLEVVLNEKKDVCACDQCKLDMACYALNKIRPMYVVSSRGIIHSENEKRENNQKDIDVMSVVVEAVNVVSKTRRHDEDRVVSLGETNLPEGIFFSFPGIIGRIMHSDTLEPATDVEVTLNFETGDEPVKMFNHNWTNPVKLVTQMDGTFTFWPYPIEAGKAGIQKDFQLNLKVVKKGYSTIRKFFEVRVVSGTEISAFTIENNVYHLDNIYLYKEEI